ncbi:hypothetical protein GGF42_001192 [Coemansia sp. RSA 2424]|nr:hypothetical protein GGF42_001192 [Coemansia sp. RSA 2424]
MAPNARKFDVWSYPDAEELVKQHDIHAVDLIQQLYGIVETRNAITGDCRLLVEYLDLEPIRNLVHVVYHIKDSSSRIMPLIRRSAQTLQSLDLCETVRVDYTELIRDPDSSGRWMEYPCLHMLRLFSEYENSISRGSISNGAAPFPQLRRLAMRRAYPFGDDVLFRGNAATLEYLEIELDPEMVAMLKRHKVFAHTSHPKLQCVNINLRFSDAPGAFATASEYMQFALSIAPRASVLAIPYLSSFGGRLTTELEILGSHDSIQFLSLYSATLPFWDVVNLVKSLPLLSDLETVCSNFRAMVCSLNSQTYTLSLTLANHESKENFLADANGCPWIVCPKFNDYSTHRLAKRLAIDVELGCIYSGMASELLSRVPYKDCIFPVVRAVAFTFSLNPDDTGDDIDASVVQANTTAFVQQLLQLAPRVRECDFNDHFDYEEISELNLGQFSSLARQILANVDRLKFALGDDWVGVDLDYAGICNLVHIDYAFDLDDCSCFQLVQQCAPILQSLILRSRPYTLGSGLDSSKLIWDTNGSCIVYSCLQSLSLEISNESDTLQRQSFGSFVAFPVL